jgi:hypothetical protein
MPSACPYCYSTGRNKRGGPCKHCRASGAISTPLANSLTVIRAAFFLFVAVLVLIALIGH